MRCELLSSPTQMHGTMNAVESECVIACECIHHDTVACFRCLPQRRCYRANPMFRCDDRLDKFEILRCQSAIDHACALTTLGDVLMG